MLLCAIAMTKPLGTYMCTTVGVTAPAHTLCPVHSYGQVLLLQDVHNVEAPFLSVPGKDVLMKDAGELKEDLQQRKEEERHNIALRLEQQHK